jgi:hypothetical protein
MGRGGEKAGAPPRQAGLAATDELMGGGFLARRQASLALLTALGRQRRSTARSAENGGIESSQKIFKKYPVLRLIVKDIVVKTIIVVTNLRRIE